MMTGCFRSCVYLQGSRLYRLIVRGVAMRMILDTS